MVNPERVSSPSLVKGKSITLILLAQLLDGIEIEVEIDGKKKKGYVVNLNLSPGSPHFHAVVNIPAQNESEDDIHINVAIKYDGEIMIMPHQLE